MAEVKTLRAMAHQMRAAAGDLRYAFGTDWDGSGVVPLGIWEWDVEKLPELQPLSRIATPQQDRDYRSAKAILRKHPPALLRALMVSRLIIGEAIQRYQELTAEGYAKAALDKQLRDLAKTLLNEIEGTVGDAAAVARAMADVRRDLAKEFFQMADGNSFYRNLDLEGPAERDPRGTEAQVAVQSAIFDAEIARALKPLTPADRTLVIEARALPKQLDDARVLSAVFRVPQALLPFADDELRGIARLAFQRQAPHSAAAASVVEEMLEVVRPVAGQAILRIGMMRDPVNPYDTFRDVKGGLWALQPMLRDGGTQARQVFDDLAEAHAMLGVDMVEENKQ